MGPPRVPCCALATAAVLLLSAGEAFAGDDEEVQAAVTRVEAQKFPEAIARLEVLLDPQATICPATPELTPNGCRLANPELIVAARAQYALAMFGEKGRTASVYTQVEAILRSQPTYQPNTSLFPQGLVDVFVEVRGRLAEENVDAARKKADAAQRAKELEEARRKAEADYIAALEKQAAEESVLVERSRLYAFVPFGVGQYQNDDGGLALGFAAFEAVAGVTSIVTALVAEDLETQRVENEQVDDVAAQSQIDGWQLANRVAFGVFLGSAVTGMVEANVSYDNAVSTTRQRPLPRRKTPTATVAPILGPSHGGAFVGATGRF